MPDDLGFMARLGAVVGVLMGAIAVLSGAAWWALPLLVLLNILLAVSVP